MHTRNPSPQNTPIDVPGSKSTPVAKLGPEIEAKIGQQFRLMYGEVVDEEVPERFVEILRRLDDPTDERAKKKSS